MLVFQKILHTYYKEDSILLTLNKDVTCASELRVQNLARNGAVNIITPILQS